jgi:hypothetical protein
MDEWAYRIGLKNKYQNIAHCLVRDDTTAVNLPAEKEGDIKQIRVYKILNLIKKSQGPDSNRNGTALQAIA